MVFRKMTPAPTRRHFLLGALSVAVAGCRKKPTQASASLALAEIEQVSGGRLGVCAIDTATGKELHHRSDERFAMCSTFKWVLAAAVLERIDRGVLSFEQRIALGEPDLLEYAPVSRRHVADGFMTIEALAEAAVTVSDNTAANLLLRTVDGPAGLTHFIRDHGDSVTRLDRDEPMLNTNEPGDARDSTTPRAMAHLMRRLLADQGLRDPYRARLLGWMRACETGNNRLRAGFPHDWIVGDKTGSGLHNAINDVAIAAPPGRAPILVAAYLSGGSSTKEALEAALAKVSPLVAREL
jgi:beta-lactamase class A